MFKRFLKFFRGDERSPEEPFEGSYLDHLLEQVRPMVGEQLEECPDHDPLLLVVAGILRLTMMNEWSPQLRSPLTDSQSPGRVGRDSAPGPIANPAPESDTTNEFEAHDDDSDADEAGLDPETDTDEEERAAAEAANSDAESDSDAEDSDAEDSDAEDSDAEDSDAEDSDAEDSKPEVDADPTAADRSDEITASGSPEDTFEGPPPAPAPRSTRKTEEIDVEEVRKASLQRAAEEQAAFRKTAEMDAFEPDPTIEIDQDALFEARGEGEDGRPRLDTEEVLQAGRVFLGLLIENDRLPLELQLTVGETTLARDLLLGYFVGNEDVDERARHLLTLVEQKFGDGMFSQARILLELFHTDEQTRISNDRNLFYEDMILRLGIRRRHRLSKEDLSKFASLASDVRSVEGTEAVCSWLNEHCGVKFHSFNRSPGQVDSWTNVLDGCTREGGAENFLRYVPPRRWRPVTGEGDLSTVQRVSRHISQETARDFVLAQLKTCYFVLRAVGDTGLESYLDTFFDWTKERFDLDGTRLMPELYKRSMMDPEPMDVILNELFEEYFAEATREAVENWSDEDVEEALYHALETIGKADLSEVAPGLYDLGAFTYDRLFGVEYPTPEFSFKVHRLT